MSKNIKCLDCETEFTLDYESYKDLTGLTEEDINNRIKNIEELTNFKEKKNICLNCLERLIRAREDQNSLLINEKDQLSAALENLMSELESKEFGILNF